MQGACDTNELPSLRTEATASRPDTSSHGSPFILCKVGVEPMTAPAGALNFLGLAPPFVQVRGAALGVLRKGGGTYGTPPTPV